MQYNGDKHMYDLIVIGAGPAAFGAGVYAGRYKMKTLIVGTDIGGTANEAHWVENYPGLPGMQGMELAKIMRDQAEKFGAEIKLATVTKAEKTKKGFKVTTEEGAFEGKTLLIATGMKHRQLNVPGEEAFHGRGVSYCYTCDGPLFRNKTVAVIGGSDSACNGAQALSEHASKVYLIYRGEALRAEPVNAEAVKKNKKIEIIYNANLKEIQGKELVTGVVLDNGKTLALQGVFIEAGSVPVTAISSALGVKANAAGFIAVDDSMATNVPGVFAAGDITEKDTIKQVIVAVAQGSIAAIAAYKHNQQSK